MWTGAWIPAPLSSKRDVYKRQDLLRAYFDKRTFAGSVLTHNPHMFPTVEFANIVLKGPDVEANWRAWVDEKMQVVQPLLDELTEMKQNQ